MTETSEHDRPATRHRVLLGFGGSTLHFGAAHALYNASLDRHDVVIAQTPLGAWDAFNKLWADALNGYADGQFDAYALIHGDIEAEIGWLDIELEEMDRLGADVVSAVVPIKDARGRTSCGIGNLRNRWLERRCFTMTEIMEFPETFSAADAGCPGEPFLVNDGCMVCDLRNPRFHEVDDHGVARVHFGFPADVACGPDGRWRSRRESEDWFFSRCCHEQGLKVYATRRVKILHHGDYGFPNQHAWGTRKTDDDARKANQEQVSP